jgi:hypothetical protein
LQKLFQVFLENDNLMPLKIRLAVFLALHDIQKNVAIAIFLDIEKVCPSLRL